MLNIQTFDNRAGGNVLYKALAHPLAAEAIARLYARLAVGPVALYDPEASPRRCSRCTRRRRRSSALYVHDVTAVGTRRAGMTARALTELPDSGARTVLIAAFDAERIAARIAHLLPPGAEVVTLDEVRLPARAADQPRALSRQAELRDEFRVLSRRRRAVHAAGDRRTTGPAMAAARSGCGCGCSMRTARCWRRGSRRFQPGPADFRIDSRAVRERFGLPPFTGQLFVHAIGAAGHDVVKYALDTYALATTARACRARMTPMPGRRIATPACRRRARTSGWCCGCRTATPRRSRPARRARSHGRGAAGRVAAGGGTVRDRRAWMSRSCCRTCAGRRRSRCAPGGTSCGRAMR